MISIGSRVRIKDSACSKWEQAFAAVNDEPMGEVIRFFNSFGIPYAAVRLIGSDSTYAKPIESLEEEPVGKE